MTGWVVLAILVLAHFASAFYSGAETAILSVNRLGIRDRMEKGDRRAALLWSFFQRPEPVLAGILIGNNLSGVVATAVLTEYLIGAGVSVAESVATGILVPTILFFGEILPKAAARRTPEPIALWAARPLDLTMLAFSPLVRALDLLSSAMARLAGASPEAGTGVVTREEIRGFIEREAGESPAARQLIRGAWQFARASVREVMIPLTRVCAIESAGRLDEAFELARRTGFTRFPVYRDRIDQVIGVLDLSELVWEPGLDHRGPIAPRVREALLLPNTLPTQKAILALQRARESMAIVIDEYGGCDGIVLMKDMFEEVAGDLEGPEGEGPEVRVETPGTWLVDGLVDIDHLNDELGLDLPKQGYETLSGFLMTALEGPPRVGQRLHRGRLHFEVVEVRARVASSVRITLDGA